jgi:8-hydroxy-5-deazaflavin:NADPH oxidoreductase
MKIGILGTGVVGNTIGSKLIESGHEVKMGSRTANNEKAAAWVNANGANASHGTFSDAAAFGEIIFNATKGEISIAALELSDEKNLNGKVLIDIANPLDFSNGFPPTLSVCNTNSLGEIIQKTFPQLKVVKALNTINCGLMLNPMGLKGKHDLFICGNDAEAKSKVTALLQSFGWKNIHDLGDITNARATEMLLPVWVRLYGKFHTAHFNFHIVK